MEGSRSATRGGLLFVGAVLGGDMGGEWRPSGGRGGGGGGGLGAKWKGSAPLGTGQPRGWGGVGNQGVGVIPGGASRRVPLLPARCHAHQGTWDGWNP